MMWAVLGVVAPPDDAVLAGTREHGDRLELFYRVDGSVLRSVIHRTYRLEDTAEALRHLGTGHAPAKVVIIP